MAIFKCVNCGEYDDNTDLDNNKDLCFGCQEEDKQRQLKYDALECGFTNVDEYLAVTTRKY